jgi:ribonuclease P/MRP protein subunit RPP1
MFDTYDIIALVPTTQATFSLACLTHSQPSPLTAHVIALPLTLPRLSFHMKHTLVRTAIKNGSVFEINYSGALGGQHDAVIMEAGVGETGASAKRNWWAAAREVVRVTKGKSLLLSGGVASAGDLRAPRDVGNLYVACSFVLQLFVDINLQSDDAWITAGCCTRHVDYKRQISCSTCS